MIRVYDKSLLAAAGVALGLMAVNVGITFRNARSLREHGDWVVHTHEVMAGLDHVLSLVEEAESSQRGYIITGEDRYLEPYHAALGAVNAEVDRVERLTADNPQQQARFPRLRQRLADRLATLEYNLNLRRDQGLDAARDSILTDRGKNQMDALRATLTELVDHERSLLDARARQADATYRTTIATDLLSGLSALAAVGVLLVSLRRNLAARTKAAALLAQERELLQTTLASIGDAVITTDTAARVTYLNAVAQHITGWSQHEAAGQPLDVVFNILNEQTRETVENPAVRSLRDGVIVGLANHTVLLGKDGVERPIDDSAAPIRDEQGRMAGCVLVFRDVSDRRQADRALRDSEQRKAAILETALDCIISMDHQGNVVEWNPAAEQTFGYRREDAVGRQLAELIIPPALRARHYNGLAHYLATGEGPVLGRRLELPGMRSDGCELPMELAITRLRVDPPVFTAHIRDITQREAADAALRESEAKYRTLIEQVKDYAIFRIDTIGRATTWNEGVRSVLGFEQSEFVGRDVAALIFTPEDVERGVPRQELETAAAKGSASDDRWMKKKDGARFWASGVTESLRDEHGKLVGFSKVMRDRTEPKRLEDELRQFAAELSEADRRKNEFLAMLAHELRNPLAPIRNALEIMRRSHGAADQIENATEMMQRQVGQMVRLIDDLLDVSRISRGAISLKMGRVELASIINHAAEAVRGNCDEQGQQFAVELPPEPVYLHADPARLTQIVGNLLNNACKFTGPGGRIRLTAMVESGQAVIRVEDTGIGIAADQLPVIFDMFTQGDTSLERSQSGLGIGLTLVKKLVELHGGNVEAHSAGIGHGSRFTVRLPIKEPPAPSPPKTPAAEAPVTGRRILVVDDNRDAAQSLAALLKLAHNQVRLAYDGEEALAAAINWRPEVVLLDIGLPKLNGYEVARRLRAQPWGSDPVLVALTGWGQDEDRVQSSEAGFDGHLVKPVEHAALMSLLADALPRA